MAASFGERLLTEVSEEGLDEVAAHMITQRLMRIC